MSAPTPAHQPAASTAVAIQAPPPVPARDLELAYPHPEFFDSPAEVERSGREGVERLRLERKKRHKRQREARRRSRERPPERTGPQLHLPSPGDLTRPEGGRWHVARLYYEAGSRRMGPRELEAIASLGEALADVPDGRLHVAGYADLYSETETHPSLALDRAILALEALTTLGGLAEPWLADRLSLVGHGERGDPDDGREWRRVDVFLYRARRPAEPPARRSRPRNAIDLTESPTPATRRPGCPDRHTPHPS